MRFCLQSIRFLFLLLLFSISGKALQVPAQEMEITIPVNLYVDGKEWQKNLRPGDLKLYQNGLPQQILDIRHRSEEPLELAVLIDTSRSQRPVLPAGIEALVRLVDSVIRSNVDRVCLIDVNSSPELMLKFTGDREKIVKKIKSLGGRNINGATALFDSVRLACEQFDLSPGRGNRRMILILSDGGDNLSTIRPQDVCDIAIRKGVEVYGIGIRKQRKQLNDDVAREKLIYVTAMTGGGAFFPDEDKELKEVVTQVDRIFRQRYLLTFRSVVKGLSEIKLEAISQDPLGRKINLTYPRRCFTSE